MYKRRFKENYEYLKADNERYIIYTNHAIDRYLDRYKEIISYDILYSVVNNFIKSVILNFKDKGGVYGFHSKSTGIGGIINWRKDNKGKNDKNNAVIVSLFPIKKFHNFKNIDAQIIVEQQIILWAKEKGFKNKFKENLCESYFDDQPEINDNCYISFFESTLYETNINEYLFLD